MRFRPQQNLAHIVFAAAAFATATACAAAPRFVPINGYDVAGISADGTVVAGRTIAPNIDGVYLWTEATGEEVFNLSPGHYLNGVGGLSGDGSTVVGRMQRISIFERIDGAFRWTRDSGFQFLTLNPTSPNSDSIAAAVSFDGSVIVGTRQITYNQPRAFRWTEITGEVDLGVLGTGIPGYPPGSRAYDISSDGSIIVGEATIPTSDSYKAYRWTTPTGFDVLGTLPGASNGDAGAISGDGSVIAGYSQRFDGLPPWTWTESSGFQELSSRAGSQRAYVNALSFDGTTLVGGESFQSNPVSWFASIWRRQGSTYQFYNVKDLLAAAGVDTMGWQLQHVIDVSHDGQTIAGIGIDPTGVQRSWFAVLPPPVPEPASLCLAALGLLTLLGNRRRRTPS